MGLRARSSARRSRVNQKELGGDFRRGSNQLLKADIVYVRDIAYPERMTTEQLSQLAMIAFHVYGSIDLALFCITELVRRGQATADAGTLFLQRAAPTAPQ